MSFRIPGGSDSSGDTATDSQMLSAVEMPPPKKSGPVPPPAPRPAAAPPPKEKPRAERQPSPAAEEENPTEEDAPFGGDEGEAPHGGDNPFAFSDGPPAPARPKAPPPEPAKGKSKAKAESPPKASPKEKPATPAPAEASGDPFSFGGEPAEAPPTPAATKESPKEKAKKRPEPEPKSEPEPEPPAEGSGDPFSFGDEPAEAPPTPAATKESPKEKAKKKPAPPPPPPSGDPFSFDGGPLEARQEDSSEESEEEPDEDSEEEPSRKKAARKPARSRGKQKDDKKGMGRLVIAAVVFGLVVGGAAGGVFLLFGSKKSDESTKSEKKAETKDTEAPPESSPKAPESKEETKEEPAAPKGKGNGKGKPRPKRGPGAKKEPAPGPSSMLGLAPGKPLQFAPLAAKPENVLEPSNKLAIIPALAGKPEEVFSKCRKVFPPLKRDLDIGVLWQTEAPFQGQGEKLLLGIYSPLTGKQVNQVTIEGDGSPEPACDFSVDGNLFAHAHTTDGKINVWNTRDGAKVIDGFNPYESKKGLKLAAVYLTEPPDSIIVVSTTGDVHGFKVATREPYPGSFAPKKPSVKPLQAGKSIATGPARQAVVLISGGAVYRVAIKPMVAGELVADIGGDVGQSFGLATSGSGKLLYAFETDRDGKKVKAVMDIRSEGDPVVHRWPVKDAGDPILAGWAGDDLAMVGASTGCCIWFEAEGKDFRPLALARTPGGKARHVASDGHWALLPDPADPKRCFLLEYSKPQAGIVGLLEANKVLPTVLLTDQGLFK